MLSWKRFIGGCYGYTIWYSFLMVLARQQARNMPTIFENKAAEFTV